MGAQLPLDLTPSLKQARAVGEVGMARATERAVKAEPTFRERAESLILEKLRRDPASGMQKGYVVLSAEERAKGFVRPVRNAYVHETCGTVTTMGRALAETYARDFRFYPGTFCVHCRDHFPVGEKGEFVWDGTTERVGT